MHKKTDFLRAAALSLAMGLAAAPATLLAQDSKPSQGGKSSPSQVYKQPVVPANLPADADQQIQQLNSDTSAPHIGKGAKGPAVLRAQVLLDRHWFSPGQIDGVYGRNMRMAITGFQRSRGLSTSGEVDAATWAALTQDQQNPAFATYQLSAEDLAGPFHKIPKEPQDQAKLDRLTYESPLEALSERFHVKPELLQALNKGRDLQAGQKLVVPHVGQNVALPEGDKRIVISKSEKMLYLMGTGDRLLGAFPVSIGGRGDDLPVGTDLKINSDVKNPDFRYDPNLLKGYDGDKAVVVPPGPNSPVGMVWMGLTQPHWGIHGTSEPSQMARVETNGCIRMTNWDVWRLTEHVGIGTVVRLVS